MNAVKVSGSVQMRTQSSAKAAAAESSGDDFMKLLQTKQNTVQPEKAEGKQAETAIAESKGQKNSAESQEDGLEESKEDVSLEDTSPEKILQQAALQQAAAQMAGALTEVSQEVPVQAAEPENMVPVENIFAKEVSQPELITEQPIQPETQTESVPIEAFHQQKEDSWQETESKQENLVYQDNSSQLQKPSYQDEGIEAQQRQVQKQSQPQVEPKTQAKEEKNSQTEPATETKADANFKSETQKEPEVQTQLQDISQEVKDQSELQGERAVKPQKVQEAETQEQRKTEIGQESGVQEPMYGAVGRQGEVQQISTNQETEKLYFKTTESELPQDLGKALAAKLPGSRQTGPNTLTVELEPASLGKLTIKLVYETGRAAVSILASNPRTLEILNQRAAEIASILEEKTGQETVIYTQPSQQQENQETDQRQGSREGQQDREERRQSQETNQHQTESFAQQLRLGLI